MVLILPIDVTHPNGLLIKNYKNITQLFLSRDHKHVA